MHIGWKQLLFVLPLGMSLSAAGPVASLTSYEPVILDGYPVSVDGVSSWPLVLGDEIGTINGPVTIVLQSGERIQVAPHSKVRLSGNATQPKVEVRNGSIVQVGSASKSTSPILHTHASGNGPAPVASSCWQDCN